MSATLSLEDRLWSKVAIGDVHECWPWTAATINSNYGRFWFDGRVWLAHRVVYLLYVSDIPDTWTVDHVCHNQDASCPGGNVCLHRRCCNPYHLEAVPKRVNLLRGQTIVAANAVKDRCVRGHEFTPDNTRIKMQRGYPARVCRQCERQAGHTQVIRIR